MRMHRRCAKTLLSCTCVSCVAPTPFDVALAREVRILAAMVAGKMGNVSQGETRILALALGVRQSANESGANSSRRSGDSGQCVVAHGEASKGN